MQWESLFFEFQGSGKVNVIFALGVMMLALGGLSLFCHVFRQSNIVAALVIGLVVGGAGWDASMELDAEINSSLIELGNVLVLFFAGLSADFSSFEIYWKQISLISIIQFVSYVGTFAGIGIGAGLCKTAISACFFGLACSMSSTIMVKNYLARVGEDKQLHGKILMGVMAVQDTVAACSFAIIEAFWRIRKEKLLAGEHPQSSMSDIYFMDRAGTEIGRAVGILIALLAILALLSKFVLDKLFKVYRKEADMLFIGSMAFGFGTCALCFLAGFSPMTGAYFAGVSLSFLPTRSHIESKIASLRGFGMTNFYFMLGIYMHLDSESLRRLVPWSLLVAALVVFFMPAIWVLSTRIVHLRGRTRFYISCISNSMGEFSFIVQILAFYAEIFDRDTHIVLLLASIWTMVLTTVTQQYKHQIYRTAGAWYTLDGHSAETMAQQHQFSSDQHVVLLGFSEVGKEIAEFYRHKGEEVALIDLDPELCQSLMKLYTKYKERSIEIETKIGFANARNTADSVPTDTNGHDAGTNGAVSEAVELSASPEEVVIELDPATRGRHAARDAGGRKLGRETTVRRGALGVATNILPIYSDPQKPIIWDRYRIRDAKLVVSCLEEQDLNGLAAYLREHNVPFVSTANRKARAKHVFETGCNYVIHQEYLAAWAFYQLLKAEMAKDKTECFAVPGAQHKKDLIAEAGQHRSFIAHK